MMFVMLVAGIGLVLAGLLATGYGISIKEFSTGNTLIIAGVIGFCTGAIMLALWMAVRELKNIARKLSAGIPEARGEAMGLPVAAARDSAAGGGFPADQCYSTIQGTSMATPHASAVLALVASAKPSLAHNPARTHRRRSPAMWGWFGRPAMSRRAMGLPRPAATRRDRAPIPAPLP